MLAIFLQTLPFFAVIAVGYGAARTGFFSTEATAGLTRFVFYFALSAMLFRFSANLSLAEIIDWPFLWAYLSASLAVYALVFGAAIWRGRPVTEAAFEGQCGAIGNTGFLGIPMLAILMGPEAVPSVILVLAVDLVVFGSLVVIVVTGARDGRLSFKVFRTVGLGLISNPMLVSVALGLGWAATGIALPQPVNAFVTLLGAAATPGALFAIGTSLAVASTERFTVAAWLSFAKLVLHPAAVAIAALLVFPVAPFPASVMIAAAALPVAGNVFILAQHYGVAPQRVSASILVSTSASVITVSIVIALVSGLGG
ncbi:MAG: AEC family transporter [Rhodobacteraceae bacterium]|nr:AEC family transporter [Paracoccaceae bacterium]